MIIIDTMDALQSMVSGKFYDSKSALREEYRLAGVTELGNERVKPREPEDDPAEDRATKQAIADAMTQLGI